MSIEGDLGVDVAAAAEEEVEAMHRSMDTCLPASAAIVEEIDGSWKASDRSKRVCSALSLSLLLRTGQTIHIGWQGGITGYWRTFIRKNIDSLARWVETLEDLDPYGRELGPSRRRSMT